MKTETRTSLQGWHFLQADKKLAYGDERLVKVGKRMEMSWRDSSGHIRRNPVRPELCAGGMHACQHLRNVIGYAAGPILCRVTVDTDLDISSGKFCGRFRTVEAMVDMTDSLKALIIDCFKYMAKSQNDKTIAAALETTLLTGRAFKVPNKIKSHRRNLAVEALSRPPHKTIKFLSYNFTKEQLAWFYRRFAHYVKKAGLA